MSHRNKEIVEKVNAAFLKGDYEAFLSLCADNVQWKMVGDRTVKGKESIRQWMASMVKENPEPPKFTVDDVIAEGDTVMQRGDMMMKDKDGKTVPYSFCDICRFRDDQIVEIISFVIKTEAQHKTTTGT